MNLKKIVAFLLLGVFFIPVSFAFAEDLKIEQGKSFMFDFVNAGSYYESVDKGVVISSDSYGKPLIYYKQNPGPQWYYDKNAVYGNVNIGAGSKVILDSAWETVFVSSGILVSTRTRTIDTSYEDPGTHEIVVSYKVVMDTVTNTTYNYSKRERLATLSVASTGTVVLNNGSELSIRNQYSLITSAGDVSLQYKPSLNSDDEEVFVVDYGNITTDKALEYVCRKEDESIDLEGTAMNMKIDEDKVLRLFTGDIIFERGDSDTILTFRGVSNKDVPEKPGTKIPSATQEWYGDETSSGGRYVYMDTINETEEMVPGDSTSDNIEMQNNFIINANRAVFNVETDWKQEAGSVWSVTSGGVSLENANENPDDESNIYGDGTIVKRGEGALKVIKANANDLTGASTGYGWDIEEGMVIAEEQKNLGKSNILIEEKGTLGLLNPSIFPSRFENNITLNGGEISIASNSSVELAGDLYGEQAHFTLYKNSSLILSGKKNNDNISKYLVTFGAKDGGYDNYLLTDVYGLAKDLVFAENVADEEYKETSFFQLILDEGRDIEYSGSLQGEMYLQKTGTGTVTLSGENTYTKGTYITEGGLLLANSNSIGTGKIMFDGVSADSSTYATVGVSGDIENVNLDNDIHVRKGAIFDVLGNQTFNLSGSIENYDARPDPKYATQIIKKGSGNVVIARNENANRKINITTFTVNEGSFILDDGVVLDSYFSLDGDNASLEMRQNAGITNKIDIFNGDLTIFNEKNVSSATAIVFHSTATAIDSFSKLHITSDTVLSNETWAGKINIAKNIEFITDGTTTAKMNKFEFGAGDDKVIVKSGSGTFVADNDSGNFKVSDLYVNGGRFKVENTNMEVSGTTLLDGGILLISGENSHFASTAAEKKITVLDGGGIGIYDANSIDSNTALNFEGEDEQNLSTLVIESSDVVLGNNIYVKTGLIIENEQDFTFAGYSAQSTAGILAKAGAGTMTIDSEGFTMRELRSLEGNLLIKSDINILDSISILGENALISFEDVNNANISNRISLASGGTLSLSTSTVNVANLDLSSANIVINKSSKLNSTNVNFDSSTINLTDVSSVIEATTINLINTSTVTGFGYLNATVRAKDGSNIYVGSGGNTGEKLKMKNVVFESGSNLYIDVDSENETSDLLEVAGDITVQKNSTLYVNFINENSGQGSVALAEGDSESPKKFKFLSFSGSSSFDNTTNEIFDIVLSNPRYSASTFLLGKDIFLQLAQEWIAYDMPGVTKNQKEMMDVFNKIYADDVAQENMKSVLSTLDAIYQEYRSTGNRAEFLNALQDLSGIFYANAFMTSTMLSKANIIYSRLNDYSKEIEELNGVWAKVYTNSLSVAENEENPKFESGIYGMIAGYDKIIDDNVTFGIAGFYGQGELKQLDDKADVIDAGVNVYGDYKVNENIDIKGLAGYSLQDYDTTRNLRFIKQDMKSKFAVNTISFDVEAAYRYDLNDNLSLRPLVGANCAIASNSDIEEDGDTEQKLKISKDSYTKAEVRVGVGLQSKAVSPFNWYVSAAVKQILMGDQFKTKSYFVNAPEYEFEIESTKLASTSFVGNIGCSYDITSRFNVSLDLNADTGSASGFGANIGAAYRW